MKTRKKVTSRNALFYPALLAVLLMTARAAEPLAEDPEEGTSPCDWLAVEGSLSKEAIHFRFRFAGPVNFDKGAAYNVYLDTDRNPATGFKGSSGEYSIGADYLVQGATIFQYSGTGSDWSWTQLDAPVFEIKGKELLLTIDLKKLGNPAGAIDFFCLGDNEAPGVDGTTPDVMPDGALMNGAKLTLKP